MTSDQRSEPHESFTLAAFDCPECGAKVHYVAVLIVTEPILDSPRVVWIEPRVIGSCEHVKAGQFRDGLLRFARGI